MGRDIMYSFFPSKEKAKEQVDNYKYEDGNNVKSYCVSSYNNFLSGYMYGDGYIVSQIELVDSIHDLSGQYQLHFNNLPAGELVADQNDDDLREMAEAMAVYSHILKGFGVGKIYAYIYYC